MLGFKTLLISLTALVGGVACSSPSLQGHEKVNLVEICPADAIEEVRGALRPEQRSKKKATRKGNKTGMEEY